MDGISGIGAVRAALAAKPDGVLESLVQEHGVPYRAVLECLPAEARPFAPPERFEEVWDDMTKWGPVTFIVHTADGVFETKASIPAGSQGRGYFNIHGESPLSGHLKAARCSAIYFVDRLFFGRRSCSVQFINCDGEAMFKVFVGRDEERNMKVDQLRRFEALRDRFGRAAEGS